MRNLALARKIALGVLLISSILSCTLNDNLQSSSESAAVPVVNLLTPVLVNEVSNVVSVEGLASAENGVYSVTVYYTVSNSGISVAVLPSVTGDTIKHFQAEFVLSESGVYEVWAEAVDNAGLSGCSTRYELECSAVAPPELSNSSSSSFSDSSSVQSSVSSLSSIISSSAPQNSVSSSVRSTLSSIMSSISSSIFSSKSFSSSSSVSSSGVSFSSSSESGVRVHFYKPANWSGAYVHNWPGVTTWSSCPAMTDEGNGWFTYLMDTDGATNLLFKDQSGDTTVKTPDFTRDREGWCVYTNGGYTWFDQNPFGPTAPKVGVNPSGGYFKETTYPLILNVSGDGSVTAYYTTNGSNPKFGSVYTNGQVVDIAVGMNLGDQKSLKLYAESEYGTNENTYVFTRTNIVVQYEFHLGAEYTPDFTTFAIWSPDSSDVKVDLNGQTYSLQYTNVDSLGYSDIYFVKVPGDHHLQTYRFKINGQVTRDPYGKMVVPGQDINVVMDTATLATEPDGGWVSQPALVNREDSIIYEVHVRDFTENSTSGVSAAGRGKFSGMTESGTVYQGVSTGIDHLVELGVTHIQIMPMYDFSTSMYNWGYDPVNYNVPEDQYASDAYNYEQRMKEVKEMVNEFHRRGIRVIMDVVYNHTFGNEMFDKITSKYFTGNNDSGCGNGINTGEPMVSRFIRDSLEYWISEYHIDGFRFDLIGIFHYDEVRKWGEYLTSKYADRNLLFYGEPWNGYYSDPDESQKVRYGTVAPMATGHVGVFNGAFREAIKGDNDGTGRGYMFSNGSDGWAIYDGIRGSLKTEDNMNPTDTWNRKFTYDPEQSVNYISAHDNLCLWDKINFSGVSGTDAEKTDKFGMGIIFTSQGIPFIHGGDEMLRTKLVNGDWDAAKNSYDKGDEVNKMDWNWKIQHVSVFNYYKDMIALRKAHPALRMTSRNEIDSYLPDSQMVNNSGAITTHITYPGDELFVVYQPGGATSVTLPAGTWTKIADSSGAVNVNGQSGTVSVDGTAVTVFSK